MHPAWVAVFVVPGAAFLGSLGIIAAILAQKFDQMAAITNFIVTPLSFLSGTFYSTETLPPVMQVITRWNPVFYLIDGVRFGMLGRSDSSHWLGLVVVAVSTGLVLAVVPGGVSAKGLISRRRGAIFSAGTPRHLLLSAASRTLSLRSICKAGEDVAYRTFCEMLWPETDGEAVCPRCDHTKTCNISTCRKFKCKGCYHQFSVTSSTIFASRKMGFVDLLAAICITVTLPGACPWCS